jgi:hypothetical protein
VTDIEILQAFYGTDTVPTIASRVGRSDDYVRKIWLRAKNAGQLPAHRPHFAAANVATVTAAEADIETMSDDEFSAYLRREDEIEELQRNANVASCDALLAALIRAHGSPANLVPDMPDIDRLVAARQRCEREQIAKAAGLGGVGDYVVQA